MKKRLTVLLLFLSTIAMNSSRVFAQANHWVIAPNVSLNANNGAASYYTNSVNVTSCSGGDYTELSVISNSNATSYYAFAHCGVYNSSGSSIGSAGPEEVFAIPGVCNQLCATGWVFSPGSPNNNALILNMIDVSNPASVTTSSSTTLLTGAVGLSVAAGPLQTDGSHTVFVSENTTLYAFTVSATGSVSAVSSIATLPGVLNSSPKMEVARDGKSIFMATLSGKILRYNIIAGTFTTVADLSSPSVPMISGFEFVPASSGTGSHDRLYVSYYYRSVPNGYGKFVYYDLDNLAAPAVDAISSYPSGTVDAGFCFSEIERAKNGRLFLAYNPVYWPNVNGNYDITGSGTLYSLNPATGTLTQVQVGSTPVSINNDPARFNYYIQTQIDGENYDYTDWTTKAANVSVNNLPAPNESGTPLDAYNIWQCNGELILEAHANSFITSRSITVEKGTVTPGSPGIPPVFTPTPGTSYTYGPHSVNFTDETINLVSVIPGLTGYSGCIRVSYTVSNGCGGTQTTTRLYRIGIPNAFVSVNNLPDPNETTFPLDAYNIWLCNDATELSLNFHSAPAITTRSITVEQGTVTPGTPPNIPPTFTPTPGTSYTYGPHSINTTDETIDLAAVIPGLSTYTGCIRVTYTFSGVCGTQTITRLYRIGSSKALVDFLMIAPVDVSSSGSGSNVCPGGTQPRFKGDIANPDFTSVSPFDASTTAPPCVDGWMGASSVGITNNTVTVVNPGTSVSYNVRVEEYQQLGTDPDDPYRLTHVKTVLNKTFSAPIPTFGWTFYNRTIQLGYFPVNYSTIKNSNYVYKVTYAVTTSSCGTYGKSSYFKILDGGTDGVYMKRDATGVADAEAEKMNVKMFPNPAKEQVSLSWSSETTEASATITLVDVVGKEVMTKVVAQSIGENEVTLDLEGLASGVYHYTLITATSKSIGKFVKQ